MKAYWWDDYPPFGTLVSYVYVSATGEDELAKIVAESNLKDYQDK